MARRRDFDEDLNTPERESPYNDLPADEEYDDTYDSQYGDTYDDGYDDDYDADAAYDDAYGDDEDEQPVKAKKAKKER